jgi:hypothetical protein
VTFHGTPLYDLRHPALSVETGVRAGLAWRAAQAAQTVLGLDYDAFMVLPRDERLTVLAQYEIGWRIEALQAWEREQQARRRRRGPAVRTRPKRG